MRFLHHILHRRGQNDGSDISHSCLELISAMGANAIAGQTSFAFIKVVNRDDNSVTKGKGVFDAHLSLQKIAIFLLYFTKSIIPDRNIHINIY